MKAVVRYTLASGLADSATERAKWCLQTRRSTKESGTLAKHTARADSSTKKVKSTRAVGRTTAVMASVNQYILMEASIRVNGSKDHKKALATRDGLTALTSLGSTPMAKRMDLDITYGRMALLMRAAGSIQRSTALAYITGLTTASSQATGIIARLKASACTPGKMDVDMKASSLRTSAVAMEFIKCRTRTHSQALGITAASTVSGALSTLIKTKSMESGRMERGFKS